MYSENWKAPGPNVPELAARHPKLTLTNEFVGELDDDGTRTRYERGEQTTIERVSDPRSEFDWVEWAEEEDSVPDPIEREQYMDEEYLDAAARVVIVEIAEVEDDYAVVVNYKHDRGGPRGCCRSPVTLARRRDGRDAWAVVRTFSRTRLMRAYPR